MKFTKYTEEMYFGKRSKIWSWFNNLRVRKVEKLLTTYENYGSCLELGSYDLFFPSRSLGYLIDHGCISFTFVDLYDNKIVTDCAEHNLDLLKEKYLLNMNLVASTGENMNKTITDPCNTAFVFETLEHVQDEAKVISNLNISEGGHVFVGAPKEFGFFAFVKDLGRLIILGKLNHSVKELVNLLLGRTEKIQRQPGGHKGYDYRNTWSLFEKNGYELIEEVHYPCKLLSYGVIGVFKK